MLLRPDGAHPDTASPDRGRSPSAAGTKKSEEVRGFMRGSTSEAEAGRLAVRRRQCQDAPGQTPGLYQARRFRDSSKARWKPANVRRPRSSPILAEVGMARCAVRAAYQRRNA